MKKLRLFVLCALWTQWSQAQMKLGSDSVAGFATVEEGRKVLTAPDDFVRQMSPFDRAARLKTDREVSEKEYLEFVGKCVLEWDDVEKHTISEAWGRIQPALEKLQLPFPKQILFIKTTGQEEGNAAYTRANAIVFPENDLGTSAAQMQRKICHELCHVLSRSNPSIREKLYGAIGFVKCGEVEFPAELKPRKITNPDAPKNDYCIRLRTGSEEHWAVPILFSHAPKYDVKQGGEFFTYLQFQFLLVERSTDGTTAKPMFDGRDAKLASLPRISGFFEQVGRNTQYIIHPEEILADNFAALVLGARDLPSPEITEKLEKILRDRKVADPGASKR